MKEFIADIKSKFGTNPIILCASVVVFCVSLWFLVSAIAFSGNFVTGSLALMVLVASICAINEL